jgi:hypothetical protein
MIKPTPLPKVGGDIFKINATFKHKAWHGSLVTVESVNESGIHGAVVANGLVYVKLNWSEIEPYEVK